MRHRKAKFSSAAQRSLEPHIDRVVTPTIRFFPNLRTLQRGELDLLATDCVYLFPDEFDEIVPGAEPQRQKRVQPRHLLVEVAWPDQKARILLNLVFRRLAAGFCK